MSTPPSFAVSVAWLPPSNSAAVRLFKYDDREARFTLTPIADTKVAPNTAQSYFGRTEAFYDPIALPGMARNALTQSEEELLELSGDKFTSYVPPDLLYFPEDQFSGRRAKLDEVLYNKHDVLISGYELSGKSSFLSYLCCLSNKEFGASASAIGIFLDFREIQKSDQKALIVKRVTELGASASQAEYLMSIGKIRLYIDNLDANDRSSLQGFLAVCDAFPLIRWTAVARGSERFMPSRVPSDLEGREVAFFQLGEVTLPTVLKMIDVHASAGNAEKPRAVVQRVFQSIHNLSAPRTMFYVRSMLDIFLNDASVEPLNRYLLIENLISERIRDAHREVFPGQPVDMQMLDSFIGILAHELLVKEVSFVTKAEFLTLAEAFIVRKGLQKKRFDPESILETLLNSRVLRQYESGFGFVILSIEDYFLAKHMSHDESFRERVMSPDGLLSLPSVAEYYIAQNPNDRPRIECIFAIIDQFKEDVKPVISEIDQVAIESIRTASPGRDCKLQDQLLEEIAAVDGADEPSMIRIADPERVGETRRVRYSMEERGAVLLQLGASILGVTRTLDQVDRIEIFHRLRELILICVKGIPLIAQHLADGNEVRLRGTTVKAEYIGQLAIQEDRFYIILRGMLYNLYKQFATWSGSPSFFNSAVALRSEEADEIVSSALFSQNIEADLAEAIEFIPEVLDKIDSMILKDVLARLYLDALTLVPLERAEESRGVDSLVDLTAALYPPKNASSADAVKRHKDSLRRRYSEDIGVNTYVGRRIKPVKGKR